MISFSFLNSVYTDKNNKLRFFKFNDLEQLKNNNYDIFYNPLHEHVLAIFCHAQKQQVPHKRIKNFIFDNNIADISSLEKDTQRSLCYIAENLDSLFMLNEYGESYPRSLFSRYINNIISECHALKINPQFVLILFYEVCIQHYFFHKVAAFENMAHFLSEHYLDPDSLFSIDSRKIGMGLNLVFDNLLFLMFFNNDFKGIKNFNTFFKKNMGQANLINKDNFNYYSLSFHDKLPNCIIDNTIISLNDLYQKLPKYIIFNIDILLIALLHQNPLFFKKINLSDLKTFLCDMDYTLTEEKEAILLCCSLKLGHAPYLHQWNWLADNGRALKKLISINRYMPYPQMVISEQNFDIAYSTTKSNILLFESKKTELIDYLKVCDKFTYTSVMTEFINNTLNSPQMALWFNHLSLGLIPEIFDYKNLNISHYDDFLKNDLFQHFNSIIVPTLELWKLCKKDIFNGIIFPFFDNTHPLLIGDKDNFHKNNPSSLYVNLVNREAKKPSFIKNFNEQHYQKLILLISINLIDLFEHTFIEPREIAQAKINRL